MTAQTEVRDYVIWSKHLHGDRLVADKIERLKPGQTLDLEVDGVRGTWRKMDQGKDGRPTPGIRPLGGAQQFWRQLFKSRRGDVVSIALPEEQAQEESLEAPATSPAERRPAVDALLAMSGQGWRSDGAPFERDTAHDR